jgi:hypothetical protein
MGEKIKYLGQVFEKNLKLKKNEVNSHILK